MDLFYRAQTVVYRGPGSPNRLLFVDPLGAVQGPFPVLLTLPPSAFLDLSTLSRRDGLGTLVWRDGATVLQELPVFLGLERRFPTRLALWIDLAQRQGRTFVGRAQDGTVETLLDPDLSLGGSAEGMFCLRLEGPEAGEYRRVLRHEDNLLTLVPPFLNPIQEGERYALLSTAPPLLDQALEAAHRAIGHTIRVEQVLDWQAVEEGTEGPWEFSLPRGWEAVFQVWVRTEDRELALPPQFWQPIPGRMVRVRQPDRLDEIREVRIVGFRSGSYPILPQGEVEGDVSTLAAQASLRLFLSGSGGPAIDPEDRMRKAVLSLQEASQGRGTRRNRVPSNARPILE
jgi:hypothetical protein